MVPPATQWQNQYKNPIYFLLLETGDFILQEDGTSFLILEQTGTDTSLWTNQNMH